MSRAHIAAAQIKVAANKRFFVITGFLKNREILDIVHKVYPDLAKDLSKDDYLNGSARENGLVKATAGNGSAKSPQHGSHPKKGLFKAPKFLFIVFHACPLRYI